jgi:hypothetical protein
MARKETIKSFELWISLPGSAEEVLDLIAGGLTLQKAAVAVGQPYTCLHTYFHSTEARLGLYLAARKAWADSVQDESMEIADGVPADRDAVAKAKLRVEVRQNQARAYHSERWGEKQDKGSGGMTVIVDRSCGGAVRVGVMDAGGNKAAIELSGAEASAIPAEISQRGSDGNHDG